MLNALRTNNEGLRTDNYNPFIEIHPAARAAFVSLYFIYNLFIPLFTELNDSSDIPFKTLRISISSLTYLIILIPFFIKSHRIGWLHPLIFPAVFGLLSSFVKNPDKIFLPFAVFTSDSVNSSEIYNLYLIQYSQVTIAFADLKLRLFHLLSVLMYFTGYFILREKVNFKLIFLNPKKYRLKLSFIIILSIGFFLYIINQYGGIEGWMLRWSVGRNQLLLEGEGWMNPVFKVGLMGCLIWYAIDDKAAKNVLFLTLSVISVLSQFFISGSRTAAIMALLYFITVYVIKKRKFPYLRIAAVAFTGFIMIGLLGGLRSSTWGGEVDWSSVTDFSLTRSIQSSKVNLENRYASEGGGSLPLFAKVPDEVDLIYGESYLSSLTFFIPRAIWEDKPRGAGIMNSRLIVGSSGGGIPIRGYAEAYWNFYIPGVIIVYLLFGMFHRILAEYYVKYDNIFSFKLIYIFILVSFTSPGSVQVTALIQSIIPILLILYWINAFRFNFKKI